MELWISKLMTPDKDRIEVSEDRESAISWIERRLGGQEPGILRR